MGKNLSDLVAVHIGYKGYYFSYIEDSLKHYYTYLFAGLNVNMIKLFFRVPSIGNWSVGVTSGIGYLKNNLPDKHSICANMGLVNSFALSKSFTVTAEISSIIGWDIYQGNWDILPGISLGVAYFFSTSSQ